jgi:hypothetical protein
MDAPTILNLKERIEKRGMVGPIMVNTIVDDIIGLI